MKMHVEMNNNSIWYILLLRAANYIYYKCASPDIMCENSQHLDAFVLCDIRPCFDITTDTDTMDKTITSGHYIHTF